jgi:hypothetical protein
MGQGQISQVDCEYPNFFAVTDLSASILCIQAQVGKTAAHRGFFRKRSVCYGDWDDDRRGIKPNFFWRPSRR